MGWIIAFLVADIWIVGENEGEINMQGRPLGRGRLFIY